MFPTNRQGINTGPSREMKCKIDIGEGANMISLDDYKKVNPSEFHESGNYLAGYSHERTALKAYGGRTIKQYSVRIINCHWENLFIKPIFHIVEAKRPILLGLNTLRKMGICQKHPRFFTEETDVHPVQIKNQASCESCRGEDESNSKAAGKDSVLDGECLGSPIAEIMDITEQWVDTENIH